MDSAAAIRKRPASVLDTPSLDAAPASVASYENRISKTTQPDKVKGTCEHVICNAKEHNDPITAILENEPDVDAFRILPAAETAEYDSESVVNGLNKSKEDYWSKPAALDSPKSNASSADIEEGLVAWMKVQNPHALTDEFIQAKAISLDMELSQTPDGLRYSNSQFTSAWIRDVCERHGIVRERDDALRIALPDMTNERERTFVVEITPVLEQVMDSLQTKQMIKKRGNDSFDSSVSLIQGNRFEVFLDTEGHSSACIDEITEEASVLLRGKLSGGDIKTRVMEQAKSGTRRDPRIGRHCFFSTFSLIVNYGECKAQFDHMDARASSFQHSMPISTSDVPITRVYPIVGDHITNGESLFRCLNWAKDKNVPRTLVAKLCASKSNGEDDILLDYGDLLLPLPERASVPPETFGPGCVATFAGGVVHSGPACKKNRFIVFWTTTRFRETPGYNADSQLYASQVLAIYIDGLWESLIPAERAFLLKKLAGLVKSGREKGMVGKGKDLSCLNIVREFMDKVEKGKNIKDRIATASRWKRRPLTMQSDLVNRLAVTLVPTHQKNPRSKNAGAIIAEMCGTRFVNACALGVDNVFDIISYECIVVSEKACKRGVGFVGLDDAVAALHAQGVYQTRPRIFKGSLHVDEDLHCFLRCLKYGPSDREEIGPLLSTRPASATVVFPALQRVVCVLKLVDDDGTISFNVIDAMPSTASIARGHSTITHCPDEQSLVDLATAYWSTNASRSRSKADMGDLSAFTYTIVVGDM